MSLTFPLLHSTLRLSTLFCSPVSFTIKGGLNLNFLYWSSFEGLNTTLHFRFAGMDLSSKRFAPPVVRHLSTSTLQSARPWAGLKTKLNLTLEPQSRIFPDVKRTVAVVSCDLELVSDVDLRNRLRSSLMKFCFLTICHLT